MTLFSINFILAFLFEHRIFSVYSLRKMQYSTKTPWMKDLNSLGGVSECVKYESPYSENPSANSIQGKNLTFGVLPNSFSPLDVNTIPDSGSGGMYRPRFSLSHRNTATYLDESPYPRYIVTDLGEPIETEVPVGEAPPTELPATAPVPTPEAEPVSATVEATTPDASAPATAESFRARYRNIRNGNTMRNRRTKEGFAGYYIPGFRGSEIVTEAFGPGSFKGLTKNEGCVCGVVAVISIIILIFCVAMLYKRNNNYSAATPFATNMQTGGRYKRNYIF